ncbi:alpha/beta fold hydrolase [Subtercola boreus]|uniref:alpha/beta fold hydrolase n=1 Tax=Subtercola boreus TaxID=120213 RepID=UPI001473495D|nr:alpha/beta fold hydrolase [Subtercola boreus]
MSTTTEATTTVPGWFTAALAQAPEVFETSVAGASIRYRTWGERGRRNIVLVHGGAAHSRWWDHIAPLLATDGRVVALDLSGHGDSEHRATYSVETWGEEVLTVARHAGLGDGFTLVGHSLGGLITTHLASRADTSVGSAIVIDSPVGTPGELTSIESHDLLPVRRRVYESAERMIERFRPVPAQSMLPYVARHIATHSITEVPGGWSWKFDSNIFGGEVLRAQFGALRRPLAYLRAETGVTDGSARAIVEASGALFAQLPETGHAPMLDQPIALVTAIRTVIGAWVSRSGAL